MIKLRNSVVFGTTVNSNIITGAFGGDATYDALSQKIEF